MKEFFDFAGEHPILTFFLAAMIIGAVIRLVPWSKKADPDD